MARTVTPADITRDNINTHVRSCGGLAGCYTVELDNGVQLLVVAFNRSTGLGYAQGRNTGCLFAFQVTGSVVRSEMVRVAAFAAVDTGDRAGTLTFPVRTAGGRINRALAGL